jgi:hypothetical protein
MIIADEFGSVLLERNCIWRGSHLIFEINYPDPETEKLFDYVRTMYDFSQDTIKHKEHSRLFIIDGEVRELKGFGFDHGNNYFNGNNYFMKLIF